jgi:hypothetical protein
MHFRCVKEEVTYSLCGCGPDCASLPVLCNDCNFLYPSWPTQIDCLLSTIVLLFWLAVPGLMTPLWLDVSAQLLRLVCKVDTVLHTRLFLSFSSISHVLVLFASIHFFALISAHLVHQRVLWRHLQHNLWESCFDLVAGYHSRAFQVDLMDLMFTLSSCESELGATCREGRESVEGLSNFMFDPWPEGTVSSWVISLCSLGWCPLLVAGDSYSNFHLTLLFVTPCPNVVHASVLWWECHQFPWLRTSGHLSLNA